MPPWSRDESVVTSRGARATGLLPPGRHLCSQLRFLHPLMLHAVAFVASGRGLGNRRQTHRRFYLTTIERQAVFSLGIVKCATVVYVEPWGLSRLSISTNSEGENVGPGQRSTVASLASCRNFADSTGRAR